ncbi:MAG: GTP-binding protein [Firmicutes bacterium]|nr:GTP-binding protein [Bacillota bacterium]
MKKLVIGLLAHVDAGKTTLIESLLYVSGNLRKLGRVDKKDAYLDHEELERDRGITIFSKQAILQTPDLQIVFLDTPGHIDFSAEMERTLQVLDYAILVISGADGVVGYTKTLWQLLKVQQIPVFIFVNKMDQEGTLRDKLMAELQKQLSDCCLDFGQVGTKVFSEQAALCDDKLLEAYLEKEYLDKSELQRAIYQRKIFPCFFGAALKLEGVKALLDGLNQYTVMPAYPREFKARVFKIARDKQGNRLTFLKITGGKLKVKDVVQSSLWEEKVDQIRIYSGEKYEVVNEVEAGSICAVTGLTQAKPGEGLGAETGVATSLLEPVLTYQLLPPPGCNPKAILPKVRQLEEEDPQLNISWDEETQEIRVQVMGEMQVEILQSLLKNRFALDVTFAFGKIVYKETIAEAVEGVGHFATAEQYAEVHLLLEPAEPGSGLVFADACSEEMLAQNWRSLILKCLQKKVHKGVLVGAPVTDLKITLVAGRGHNKYTDEIALQEAALRAVRQGLMEAQSILLEPYYAFELEVPQNLIGRAMTDIERMHGTCRVSHLEGELAVLEGKAPVVNLRKYQPEVRRYSEGRSRLFCRVAGYEPCHNAEEVLSTVDYDAENDVENPAGSVFYLNGETVMVPWRQVKAYMHVPSIFHKEKRDSKKARTKTEDQNWIDQEEIKKIFAKTFFANKKEKVCKRKQQNLRRPPAGEKADSEKTKSLAPPKEEYLLVDGYNIIFAWPELKALAEESLDAARLKLLDCLSKYQSIRQSKMMVVFDAYRVQRHQEEIFDYDNLRVVFTREAQTADHFIEKFAHEHREDYKITVATSDNLQQIIIRGAGHAVMSAAKLKEAMVAAGEKIMQVYREQQVAPQNDLYGVLSEENKRQVKKILSKNNK